MNVVYVSDDTFAHVLGVSITSLLENNKNIKEIMLFIIDDYISEENKEKLVVLTKKYNRRIEFITPPNVNQAFNIEINSQQWVLSTYLRLLLVSLLPENIDKVLYLDCDTIILNSLEELYNRDIDAYYGAGVLDLFNTKEKAKIGLNENDNYFNAGVLLLNIKKMRFEKAEQKFQEIISKFCGAVPYNDQGVINGTIGTLMMVLHPAYNVLTISFFMSYRALYRYFKQSKYYSESDYMESIQNPVIIHFTQNIITPRPWIAGAQHPYTKEWLKYKNISPWVDVPLLEDKRTLTIKLLLRFFHLIPELPAAVFARIIYGKRKSKYR